MEHKAARLRAHGRVWDTRTAKDAAPAPGPSGYHEVQGPVGDLAGTVLAGSRSDLGFHITGPLVQATSIGHVTRNLGEALWRLGYEVTTDTTIWGHDAVHAPSFLGRVEPLCQKPVRPYVVIDWSRRLSRGSTLEHFRIQIDPTDSHPKHRPEMIAAYQSDAVDLVLCFSHQCRQTWLEWGVPPEKVVVWHLGVDPLVYRPDGPRRDLADVAWLRDVAPGPTPFVFVAAGYMQPRKGVQEAVSAYCAAFRGRRDVAFIVKGVLASWGEDVTRAILATLEKASDHPPVSIINERISEYDMAALLRTADCFVNAHHLEGFGLMPLQAMACGTPPLVTDYHGPKEYATTDNTYLLPITGEELVDSKYSQEHLRWGVYSQSALQTKLLEAHADPKRAQRIAAGIATAARFTWEQAATKIVSLVTDNMGYPRRRPRKWCNQHIPLSIIMPVRDGATKLEACLKSLYAQRDWWEVLVADDASQPSEAKRIAAMCKAYPNVRLIRSDKQLGCFGARQILCEEARGDFIASLDADLDFSETADGWWEVLIQLWEERGRGIVHPLLLYPADKNARRVQSAGGCFPKGKEWPGWHRWMNEPATDPALCDPAEVIYTCGAFQFFHHTLLDVVQVDPRYFPAYYGDVDFCYRARIAGYLVWYCPEVTVIHDANSWTNAPGNKTGWRLEECRRLFLDRWGDVVAEDLKRVDETGALRRLT